ncbi:MAG TPA: hypothetical protein VI160_06365 [Gemmatimonadales bacterium]
MGSNPTLSVPMQGFRRAACRVAAGVCATASLAACGAGWHRVESPSPADRSPRQQVDVWSAGAVRRWHAVRVTSDSVSGIPYLLIPSVILFGPCAVSGDGCLAGD